MFILIFCKCMAFPNNINIVLAMILANSHGFLIKSKNWLEVKIFSTKISTEILIQICMLSQKVNFPKKSIECITF